MSQVSSEDLEYAFPVVDPGIEPVGSRVLVQLRRPKRKSKGGIAFSDDTIQAEQDNTQVGKLIAYGPLAFRNRDTMQSWAEGQWAGVGDYVRVPRYNGDRYDVEHPDGDVRFALFNDLDILGLVTGDVLKIKAYIQ